MPFPRKLLNDDEDVVLDLHPHWWFFAPHIAALVGALALGVVVLAVGDLPGAVGAAVGLIVLACLIVFGVRYSQWITINFVVTTDRLIYRHGVIAKHGIEIPLERVNTVFFSQSIFERMVGSGDLVIESAGEMGRQNFSNVRKPSAVQNEIYKQMEANENRKFDRVGANLEGGLSGGGLSVAEQLEKLEGLRDRGSITEEQYEAQKALLLG